MTTMDASHNGAHRIQRALVLGGGGFIGQSLVRRLVQHGSSVAVVDRKGRWQPAATVHRGGIEDVDLAGLVAAERVDTVFHLAGAASVSPSLDDPLGDLQRNTATTLRVLESLRPLGSPPRVLFASSAAVYGEGIYMPMDENHPRAPLSPYGVSKLAAEIYVSLYARLYGMPALSVRPFSVYGPDQRKLVIYDMLRRLSSGESPLRVAAVPEVTRDYVFVDDVCDAMVLLTERAEAAGEAYNISSGSGTSLRTLLDGLMRAVGGKVPVEFTGESRPGNPVVWTGDARRALELGVECTTPLDVGLQRTVAWYRAEEG